MGYPANPHRTPTPFPSPDATLPRSRIPRSEAPTRLRIVWHNARSAKFSPRPA